MISIKRNKNKVFSAVCRITVDTIYTIRYFSIYYAFLQLCWWLGYYITPLWRVKRWSGNKKKIYIDKFINTNYCDIIEKYSCDLDSDSIINETSNYNIWVFWAQNIENAPILVQSCYKQVCKMNPNRVIILNMNNINTYTTIPQLIIDKVKANEISLTHFSDILRVSILAENGGLWLDATCWLTEKIPDYVYNLRFFSKPSLWCMGSNIRHYHLFCFVRDILIRYWSLNKHIIDYFFTDYIINYARENIPNISSDFRNIPINNKKYNALVNLLNTPYNKAVYNDIKKDNWLFKLSYKSNWNTRKANKKTFYGKIIENVN